MTNGLNSIDSANLDDGAQWCTLIENKSSLNILSPIIEYTHTLSNTQWKPYQECWTVSNHQKVSTIKKTDQNCW